jgi:hypothetical protein
VAAMLLAIQAGADAAERYPSRPVRIIIPSGAGGITDILGRVIAPRLTEGLGQQVVIDNRPGASGVVGSAIVSKAAPDGYTLLMVFPSHVVNQSLYPDVPYDTVKAFAPITLVSAVSPVLIVNSQFPARSVQELIAIAKNKPGTLNHGSTGSGSMGHLGAVLFRSMSGTKIALVTYKGAPQALTALLSGEIQLYLVGSAGIAGQGGKGKSAWRRRETAHRGAAGRAADRRYPARLRSARLERHPRAGGHAETDHRPPEPGARQDRALARIRPRTDERRCDGGGQLAGGIRCRGPRRCEKMGEDYQGSGNQSRLIVMGHALWVMGYG